MNTHTKNRTNRDKQSFSRSNNQTPEKLRKKHSIKNKPSHSSRASKAEDFLLFQSIYSNSPQLKPVPTLSSDILVTEPSILPKSKTLNINFKHSGIPSNLSFRKIASLKSSSDRIQIDPTKEIKTLRSFSKQDESQTTKLKLQSPIRENLNYSLSQVSKFEYIDFFSALSEFNALDLSSLNTKKLWKTSFFSKLCRCFTENHDLDEQSQEICEKIVKFGYTKFDYSSKFHRNLLMSACVKVFKITEIQDAESLMDKLLAEMIDVKGLAIGCFNVLFLDGFFPDVLEGLDLASRKNDFDVMSVICKLSRTTLGFLRKKMMNGMILRSKKCFELIFFVFAGICFHFIELTQAGVDREKAVRTIREATEEKLEEILEIARRAYYNQSTQIN